MDGSDEQLLSTLSPRIKPAKKERCKGPTYTSLKKHFRRSSIYDNAKKTIPNAFLSIIEISSTESGSTKKTKTSNNSAAEKSKSTKSKSSSLKSGSDEIIPPSPDKKDTFTTLATRRKKNYIDHNTPDSIFKIKSFEINKWIEDVNNARNNQNMVGTEEAFESSVLNYDDFETRTREVDNIVNSTMVLNLDTVDLNPNKIEKINENNKENNVFEDGEDINKSCENLLDNLYGDSWRLNKNKILPSSEKKSRKDKTVELRQFPKSERKITSELYANPYLDTEKSKSNNLLKILQTKRIKAALESPFITNLKSVIDEDSPESAKSKKIVGTKLNFDEDSDYDSLKNTKTTNKQHTKANDKNKLTQMENINSDITKPRAKKKNQLLDEKQKNMERNLVNDVKIKVSETNNKKSKKITPDYISTKLQNVPADKKITRKKIQVDYFKDSKSNDDSCKIESVKEIPKKSTKDTYSFLASLSKNIPDYECDPSARVFRACYKNNKEELANKLFIMFNEKIFDNALPSTTKLEWSDRMLSTAGYCYLKKIIHRGGNVDRTARIVLSSKVLNTADRLRDTLIHEMCHAGTWIVNEVRDGHGNYWKEWTRKARLAFPELPPIKTCHSYDIQTKYVYTCKGCGYSIKRHRKSVDVERKVCGYCLGRFEVFINKITKTGEQKTVPTTPKKEPTGFALFVKENYANFKTPSLKHGDVMKLLGAKFSEMKV